MSVTRRIFLYGAAALGTALATPSGAGERLAVRIGYHKGGGLLGLLKVQGTLEKRAASRSWDVTWFEFPAGPQLLEGLNAGSVDFGYTGAPPPIFAQAAGVDLVYVGAEPVSQASEAVIVKSQAAAAGILDLKGRSIAVQKGSSAHYLLLASLDKAGMQLRDLQVDYLQPSYARAAFDSDRVDAWSIWDPHLASVQATYPVRTVADYSSLSPVFGFYSATRRLVEQRPDVVAELIDSIAAAGAWAMAHPDAAAALLAPLVGLTVSAAESWQRRIRYGVMPVNDTVVAAQQRVADTFFRYGLIPARVSVAGAVWRRRSS